MSKGIELGVGHRLNLPMFLPAEGNRLDFKLIDSIKEKIEFTSEELIKCEYQTEKLDSGQIATRWNENIVINVEFEESELQFIKAVFVKLDSEKKLDSNSAKLYDLFV